MTPWIPGNAPHRLVIVHKAVLELLREFLTVSRGGARDLYSLSPDGFFVADAAGIGRFGRWQRPPRWPIGDQGSDCVGRFGR